MDKKLNKETVFTREHTIFLLIVYCVFEIMMCCLFPFNLSYKYLKLTKAGFLFIILYLCPVFLCVYNILFYNKGKIFNTAILILFCMTGAVSPLFTVLYSPTVSETYDVNHYLVLDQVPQTELNFDNFYFPEKIPDNVKDANYHYKFSEEGMKKGLQISLLLEFSSKEDYRLFKETLPMSQTGKRTDGALSYELVDDASRYSIEFIIEN